MLVLVARLPFGALLTMGIERPFVIRGGLKEPDGWSNSVLPLFAYLLAGTLFAFIAWGKFSHRNGLWSNSCGGEYGFFPIYTLAGR